MQQLTMYEAAVPAFAHGLRRLAALVALAEAHTVEHALDAAALLDARLAPSMFPFATQVEIAAQFSLRACAPLAQREVPAHGDAARRFADLTTRIDAALAFLDTLAPHEMDGAAERIVSSRAGLAELHLPGREFLLQYALPNFHFHRTTAYCILRQRGVAVGKGDYDGYHVYAP